MADPEAKPVTQHIQRNLVAGVLTLIPIVTTWVVVDFLLGVLSRLGNPIVRAMTNLLREDLPALARFVENPILQSSIAVIVVIAAIYMIGWAVSRVIGARLLTIFDKLITRIPLIRQVYGSVKSLVNVLQQRPDSVQRVVMIEFPTPEMKTVGLVTRTMRDEQTGEELAAVYVPTTPNPTSGYLEVVPIDRLVSTDWSLDEAMNFIISGGAVARDKIAFSMSTPSKPTAGAAAHRADNAAKASRE